MENELTLDVQPKHEKPCWLLTLKMSPKRVQGGRQAGRQAGRRAPEKGRGVYLGPFGRLDFVPDRQWGIPKSIRELFIWGLVNLWLLFLWVVGIVLPQLISVGHVGNAGDAGNAGNRKTVSKRWY